MTSRGVIVGVLVTAAVGGAGLAVTAGGGGGGPTPGTANVWIVDSGTATCTTRLSTPVALASAAASSRCTSWQSAFTLASCGDTVLVDSGDYGSISLNSGHSGTCAEITMAAAPGATVTADDFALGGASNVRVAGEGWDGQNAWGSLTIGETDPSIGSPDLRGGTNAGFDGIDVVSSGIIRGGTDVFFVNSDIGPYNPPSCPGSGFAIGNEDSGGYGPVDGVTFSGNLVHDFEVGGCTAPNDHLDCVHIYEFLSGPTLFERNVFDDCENYGILFGSTLNSNPEDATFRNNWFGPVDTNCGFALRGSASENFTNVLVENNSGTTCVTTQTTNTLTNVVARNNAVSSIAPCRWTTSTNNKQSAGGGTAAVCGSGDAISQVFGFLNTTTDTLDFHITGGSSLVDAGATCPTFDYDNETRTGTCDVGSDQP